MTAVSSALQYGHFMGVLAGNDALRAGGLPHAVHRMATAQPGHFGRHALEGLPVLRRVQHIGDEIGEVLRLGGSTIHPSILVPLVVMVAAFTLLFLTLHLAAMRNEILRRRVRTMLMLQADARA